MTSNAEKRIALLRRAFKAGFETNRVLTLGEAVEMFWARELLGVPFTKAEPKVLVAFEAGHNAPQNNRFGSKREPWQGQPQLCSVAFQETMQPSAGTRRNVHAAGLHHRDKRRIAA